MIANPFSKNGTGSLWRCVLVTVGLLLVPAARAQQGAPDADTREVLAYRFTLDKVRRLDRAIENLSRLVASDAALRNAIAESERKRQAAEEQAEEEETKKSISDTVREIERIHPKIAVTLQAAGTSTRELIVAAFAWLQAGFALEMKKSGMLKEIPPDVSKENVAFLEANAKEMQALAERWKKLSAELRLDRDESR